MENSKPPIEKDELFFAPFTAQRRELRKIWSEKVRAVRLSQPFVDKKRTKPPIDEKSLLDWEVFLANSDTKAVKVADALNLSLLELSRTYDINEIFNLFNDLYKNGKHNDRKNS